MQDPEPIGDDEIILRRIPPAKMDMESTAKRSDGGLRAASWRLATEAGEKGLSCSRLCQTSPRQLLDQLTLQDSNPDGWFVCRMYVRDVRAMKLEVIHCPTEIDSGHCEIRNEDGSDYPNAKKGRLAKKTRILTDHEVATVKAGVLVD